MDANHLRIDALLGMNEASRVDLRVRARASRVEAWVDLQCERVPAPGRLNVFQRRNWNHLIARGSAVVASWIDPASDEGAPRELEGWLIPVWRGDNDVEEPVDDGWSPAAVLLADRDADSPVPDALFIDEMLPEAWQDGLPAAFRIRWMRQPVLRLVDGASPGMPGIVEEAGRYALIRVPIDTLVAVTDIHPVASGAPPTTSLPAYTERLVPVEGLSTIDASAGLGGRIEERLDALVTA